MIKIVKEAVLLLTLFALLTSSQLMAYAPSVAVSIPDFPVVVNGQLMDNSYNQYPVILYNNITYFPMAYEYARFLGVKANWYEKQGILFVGVAESPSNELKQYATDTANKKSYTANIPFYKIALNSTWDFLDNAAEEYPLLNFRDITYFPLTWRFAVEEFGWEYSWDSENGLHIDSSDPFRPVIDDRRIGDTSPRRGFGKKYFYGEDYYVGYPNMTWDNHHDFVVRKRGEAERTFNLKDQLTGDESEYLFNSRLDTNGPGIPVNPISDIKPSIDGSVFSIVCINQRTEGNQSVLLKIDLDAELLVSEEVIPPRQADR